jgi:hypothetical protein
MQNLSQLFTNWIDLIHKIVPEHNPYFNLTSGISDAEIEAHKSLENGIEIARVVSGYRDLDAMFDLD